MTPPPSISVIATADGYLGRWLLPTSLLSEAELQAAPSALSSGILNAVFAIKDSQRLRCVDQVLLNQINKELRSQLAESQPQFEDLKEKFLIIQATAYSLAKQLKKYKYEEYKDIIDSVLWNEVQFIEEKLAEKLRQLRSSENDADVTDAETENIQESPAPSYSPSDSNQPQRSTKVTFEGGKVDSSLVVDSECSQDEGEEALNILPATDSLGNVVSLISLFSTSVLVSCESDCPSYAVTLMPGGNQNDDEKEEGKGPVPPRLSQELPQVNEQEVPEDSLDEIYLTP
ncbi:NBPF family member NBPF6-like [Callithrix jacchus]